MTLNKLKENARKIFFVYLTRKTTNKLLVCVICFNFAQDGGHFVESKKLSTLFESLQCWDNFFYPPLVGLV